MGFRANVFLTIQRTTLRAALGIATIALAGSTAFGAQDENLFPPEQIYLKQGFEHWTVAANDACNDCEIAIVPLRDEVRTPEVTEFIQALVEHKNELQELYGIHGKEYTQLAHIAIGVLGCESKFTASPKYILKENLQVVISTTKVIRSLFDSSGQSLTPNSRGPTQIKEMPQRIAEAYGITPENLNEPRNAALATMGKLIEFTQQLKRWAAQGRIAPLPPSQYADYLPYFYLGYAHKILDGTANPDKHKYVAKLKRYMSWVEVYARPQERHPLASASR